MFGKNDNKADETPMEKKDFGQINGFIGKGMSVEGKLSFEGTVTVEGHFTGDVVSGGILIVGESGLVEGDVSVDNVIVHGEVRGTINAKTKAELNKPAKVRGDIFTPNLIICEGVLFEGQCNMGGNVSELKSFKEAKESPQIPPPGGFQSAGTEEK